MRFGAEHSFDHPSQAGRGLGQLVDVHPLGERPWGEVVPRWIPLVGGRTVPVRAAVTAASLGATFIFGVYAYALLNPIFDFRVAPDLPGCPSPLDGPGAWVAVASYAPLLVWGPLLVVVTVAYYRRRSHITTTPSRTDRNSKMQAAG